MILCIDSGSQSPWRNGVRVDRLRFEILMDSGDSDLSKPLHGRLVDEIFVALTAIANESFVRGSAF
jgi:hypothetical protein